MNAVSEVSADAPVAGDSSVGQSWLSYTKSNECAEGERIQVYPSTALIGVHSCSRIFVLKGIGTMDHVRGDRFIVGKALRRVQADSHHVNKLDNCLSFL
jgi:hypothetical protein